MAKLAMTKKNSYVHSVLVGFTEEENGCLKRLHERFDPRFSDCELLKYCMHIVTGMCRMEIAKGMRYWRFEEEM